jgi:hypothetical protein
MGGKAGLSTLAYARNLPMKEDKASNSRKQGTLRTLLIACLFVASSGTILVQADGEQMSGPDIRKAIIGKRIYLAAPLGGEFPLYYRKDGQVDGSGEAVGLGRWIRPTDSGRWWIESNRLCQQWTTWYEGRRHCFTLQRLGDTRIAWNKDNGQKGIARIGE